MPNWGKVDNKDWNTKYEATEKGWVYAQCKCYSCNSSSSNNAPGLLIVNGVVIIIAKNNNGAYDNASVFIPVAKGDTYNAIGGYSDQSISFFPCLDK